jgi:hypothetical protein
VFSGGLAQLAPLRNLVCARLQSEYRMCPSSEDTLVGLFALALAASRRTPTVRAAIAELADKRLEN